MKRTVHLTGEQRKQIAIDVLEEILKYKGNPNMRRCIIKVKNGLKLDCLKPIEIREEI